MRTLFALIVFVTCMSPAAFAAEKLSEKWNVQVPDSDTKKNVALRSAVTFTNKNEAVLANRGTLVAKDEFATGAYIEFQWMWTEGGEKKEGEGDAERTITYYDTLTVAMCTEALQPNWSYEVEDGLLVRFNPNSSTIVLELRQKGMEPKNVLVLNNMVFRKNTLYTIKIKIDTEKEWLDLSLATRNNVHVNQGCFIPVKGLPGKKVAVYNRESVADIAKSSLLKNVRIAGKENQIAQK